MTISPLELRYVSRFDLLCTVYLHIVVAESMILQGWDSTMTIIKLSLPRGEKLLRHTRNLFGFEWLLGAKGSVMLFR